MSKDADLLDRMVERRRLMARLEAEEATDLLELAEMPRGASAGATTG